MEKKRIDFNKPLLSARRFSSPTNSSELVKRIVLEKRTPGRQHSLPLNISEWESDEISKPATVPFHWEHTPGRPKTKTETQSHARDEPSNMPRLPPGRLSGQLRYNSGERSKDQNINKPQVEAFSFSDHAGLLEKLSESLKCKDESGSESGGDDDEAFSDALDELSLTGISEHHSSGLKSSGTYKVDVQTRDFMMRRFLPAAKAVVLETPHVVKKPTVVLNEQPLKEVKKVVSGEMNKPLLLKHYSTNVYPYPSPFTDNVESEDEDHEPASVRVKKSGKSWGILPKFCVKNSLCLLNPLPAMKSKSRPPTPPASEVRRLRRNAVSGPLDKNACPPPPPKKKYHSGQLSRDKLANENKSTNDSYQFSNSPRTELSPLRRYRSGSISPYRNESPKSAFREGAGFLGVPKEVDHFNANKIASSRKLFKALQDVSRNQINESLSSGVINDAVDKTVYVDSVKKMDRSSSKLPPPRTKADGLVDFSTFEIEENYAVKKNRNLDQECNVAVPSELKFELDDDGKECDMSLMKSPLPPPLPKSPSESWLWRTLPSIPLGNPFAHSRRNSQHHSKKKGQKGSATDTKWENIVKSTNLRHDHVRYSEELIPHAAHRQSKS